MVVYTTDTDRYEEVAERIAADRQESVVRNFETAVEGDDPVVWVDSPDIGEHGLLALQKRLLDRGPDDGAFSIITGYTPELAAELYFTRSETEGEDALLFRHAPDRIPDPPNTNVVADDRLTVDAINRLTSERLRSFEIDAGGRPIHVFLSDGYICGFPESQRIEDYPEPQPFCVSDGERDCPVSDNLISAESINASHIFLMSCASAVDNGMAELPVHVPLGMLNGAESLIGTYRFGASLPHELLLHHSLLAAGYDVTERCYHLNKHSHVNAIMSYPYISFGRPNARVVEPHEPQFEIDTRSGSDEGVSVHITDIDAYVIDVRIPEERLPSKSESGYERLYVRNRTETEETVYYTIFEDGSDARMLVYTGGLMQFDRIELEISEHRARHIERQMALMSAKNSRRTAEMGFLNSVATDRAAQLNDQIQAFPEQTAAERFDATAHTAVQQSLSTVYGQINAIREEILSSVTEKSKFILYEYASHAADDAVYPSQRSCTICGDRPLFIKQVTAWPGKAKRLFSSCPQCGIVFDVPATEKDVAPTYPVLSGDLEIERGETVPMEIAFENTTDTPMQATFQPLLLHMDAENGRFEPERRDAVLLPGETHTAEFTIDSSTIPDNMYYILGLVVSNLDVYAGLHTMVVGDKSEYYPRHLR